LWIPPRSLQWNTSAFRRATRRTLKEWCVGTLGGKLIYADGKPPPAFFVALPGCPTVEIYAAATSLAETGNNALAG
jgi:hypothetical protein